MKIKTTYENISTNYPEIIDKIIGLKKKSKSKDKNIDISQFNFHFEWCESIGCGGSLLDFINDTASQKEQPKITLEQKVQERCKRLGVSICANYGRLKFQLFISSVPHEVEQIIREQEVKEEQRRIIEDSKSPEQKQKEADEAIKALSKMGGFFMIRMKK